LRGFGQQNIWIRTAISGLIHADLKDWSFAQQALTNHNFLPFSVSVVPFVGGYFLYEKEFADNPI